MHLVSLHIERKSKWENQDRPFVGRVKVESGGQEIEFQLEVDSATEIAAAALSTTEAMIRRILRGAASQLTLDPKAAIEHKPESQEEGNF